MRLLSTLALIAATSAPAMAQPPSVVADIAATGSLTQMVLGDLGQVRVLLPAGANTHHHQMRPSDARALQDAGLLVWIGPELTPWLQRAATSAGDDGQLQLLRMPGTHQRDYEGAGADHPAADHDHAPGEAPHVHAGLDPHAWLDPSNAAPWLRTIAERLATLDPDNAATYRANASAGIQQIAALDRRLMKQLEPIRGREFIVFHDAYGYFTEHFDLRPGLAVQLGDASTPSAARLSELRDQIADSTATCAFPAFGQSTALIDAVVTGTQVRVGAPLDPEGGAVDVDAQLYPRLMMGIADALTECMAQS